MFIMEIEKGERILMLIKFVSTSFPHKLLYFSDVYLYLLCI